MRLKRALEVLLVVMSLSQSAWAFDCKKASTPTEKAICESESLVKLDAEVAAAYTKARSTANATWKKAILGTQKEWLIERDACGANAKCIEKSMRKRLQNFAPPPAASPFVIREVTGPKYDVVYPVVVSGPPGSGTEKLRSMLSRIGASEEKGCGEDAGQQDDEYYYHAEVVYSDATFFTVKTNYNSFCGGAHPNRGWDTRTWLVGTGDALKTRDVLLDTLDYDTLVDLASEYASDFERPSEDCAGGSIEAVAVVDGGIRFTVQYGYAAGACAFDVTIPKYAVLQHLKGELAQ